MRSGHLPDFTPRMLDYWEFLTWRASVISCGGSAIIFVSILEGDLTAQAMVEAWRVVYLRHPMLGATVEEGPGGARFVPLAAFPTPRIWTTAAAGVAEALIALTGNVAFRPGSPLYQVFALLNPTLGRHAFLLAVNHCAGDAAAILQLDQEIVEQLNVPDLGERQGETLNRKLPPTFCGSMLNGEKRWRFARYAAIELTRPLHTNLIPHQGRASFDQRRTRRLGAVADAAETRSLIERATAEGGLAAFLSGRLLRVQFAHMVGRGLVRRRANLALMVPLDLRRQLGGRGGSDVGAISLATIPITKGVQIAATTPAQRVTQRVRAAIQAVKGGAAIGQVMKWYSPFVVRRGIDRLVKGQRQLGAYSTHLGSFVMDRDGRVRRLAHYGFSQMQDGALLAQCGSVVQNGRFVVGWNFCAPLVGQASAEGDFRHFLAEIGLNADAATRRWSHIMRRL